MRYRKHDGVYFAYYDTKYETIVAYKSFSLSLSVSTLLAQRGDS